MVIGRILARGLTGSTLALIHIVAFNTVVVRLDKPTKTTSTYIGYMQREPQNVFKSWVRYSISELAIKIRATDVKKPTIISAFVKRFMLFLCWRATQKSKNNIIVGNVIYVSITFDSGTTNRVNITTLAIKSINSKINRVLIGFLRVIVSIMASNS